MIQQIVVGSSALQHYNIYLGREPKDTDIISNQDVKEGDVLINKELFEILLKYISLTGKVVYLEPDLLLTLKLSHINHDLKNNSWGKHCKDIQLLSAMGYKPNQDLLDELYYFWNSFFKDKEHIKLNTSADKFFKAEYNQTHDEIHTHFAYYSEPLYKQFLKDGADVAVDKVKWDNLSHQLKLYAVIEESMVLAYERNIPLVYGFKHLLTKCSKGWFNKFIVDDFIELLSLCKKENVLFKSISKQLKQLNS